MRTAHERTRTHLESLDERHRALVLDEAALSEQCAHARVVDLVRQFQHQARWWLTLLVGELEALVQLSSL